VMNPFLSTSNSWNKNLRGATEHGHRGVCEGGSRGASERAVPHEGAVGTEAGVGREIVDGDLGICRRKRERGELLLQGLQVLD
jgi:hypothetical protein